MFYHSLFVTTPVHQHITMIISTGISQGSDAVTNNSHTFVSLKDIDAQIKSEFAEALKEASEHVTKLCKQEKEAWVTLDEVEEQLKMLTHDVETHAERMVKYAFVT